jgi:hypothetical protein
LVPNKPGVLCVLRFEPGSPETAFHVEFPYSDVKIVEMSCGGKDRDIVILDDKGRVYVYDGWRKNYNKADQLQIVSKERIVKVTSYATRNIALVTADGRAILVETDAYHQDAPYVKQLIQISSCANVSHAGSIQKKMYPLSIH